MITATGMTDKGLVRRTNQDQVLVDMENNLFVMADGMGGESCGDYASYLAVTTIRSYFEAVRSGREMQWPFGYDYELGLNQNLAATAIKLANAVIWQTCLDNKEFAGMGTTVALVYVDGNLATIGAVGDSRVYVYRSGTLSQLTSDDSLMADLVRAGEITPEEAARHPSRHVITAAAGTADSIEVHSMDMKLSDGDRLLLCTDGIHGVLDDIAIRAVLEAESVAEAAVLSLAELANLQGAPDNMSCIVIDYTAA